MIKIVAADIDGTLTTGFDLSPKTKEVLQKLHEQGIKFGITSGRPLFEILDRFKLWNLPYDPDFVIGMNGAVLYDCNDGKTEEFYTLTPEQIQEVIQYFDPYWERLSMFVYHNNGQLYAKGDIMYDFAVNKYRDIEPVVVADDLSELYAEPQAKVLFRLHDPAMMPELEAYIEAHPTEGYVCRKSHARMMEVFHPDVNKGTALLAYGRKLGISAEEIAAFGDMTNDLEMIRDAGMGVCMLNGSDDCKAVAGYITEKTCAEDGFPLFVEKHILNQ